MELAAILAPGGFKPPVFAALTISLEYATVSLFSNGQTVVTGANGHMDALVAYRHVVSMLMDHYDRGIRNRFHFKSCKTCNIVHSGKVGHRVDLAAMAKYEVTKVVSDKTRFPGLRWNLVSNCVLVVFPSGAYQVAGCPNIQTVRTLDKIVRDKLARYKIQDGEVEEDEDTYTEDEESEV